MRYEHKWHETPPNGRVFAIVHIGTGYCIAQWEPKRNLWVGSEATWERLLWHPLPPLGVVHPLEERVYALWKMYPSKKTEDEVIDECGDCKVCNGPDDSNNASGVCLGCQIDRQAHEMDMAVERQRDREAGK